MGYKGRAKPGYEKPPASMVMTRIGGFDYPLHSEPTCKTCQSPHRIWIENALVQGRTYMGIANEVTKQPDPGPMGHPTRDNIADHFRNEHMPLPMAVKRRVIERRGEQIGANIDEAAETLVDKLTVAQMIMHVGFEQVVDGDISPTVAETIAAARLVNEIESKIDGSIDQEAWMSAVMVILDETRKLMTDVAWQQLTKRLANNPVLKAMAASQQPKKELPS